MTSHQKITVQIETQRYEPPHTRHQDLRDALEQTRSRSAPSGGETDRAPLEAPTDLVLAIHCALDHAACFIIELN